MANILVIDTEFMSQVIGGSDEPPMWLMGVFGYIFGSLRSSVHTHEITYGGDRGQSHVEGIFTCGMCSCVERTITLADPGGGPGPPP